MASCLAAALALAACGSTTPSPPALGPATSAAPIGSPAAAMSSGGPAASAPTSGGPSSALPGAGTSTAAGARVAASLLSVRLPAPLSRAVVASAGAGILVIGGVTPGGTTSAILRFDPAAGSVARIGRLATPVHDASGAPLGQGWLVLGGGQTLASAVVQDVSVSSTTASVSVRGALPAARADGAAVSVGSEVLVVGGGRGGVPDPTVLTTRDGASFAVLTRLRVAVRYPAVDASGGRVYLFGGATTGGSSNAIQAIDASTGGVQVVARLPYALTQATAFTLGGRVLIAGGMRGGQPSAGILAFDPGTGRTTVVGRLPEAVADAGVAVVGNAAYLVGGETASAFLDSVIAVR